VIQALVCLCGAVLPPRRKWSQDQAAHDSFVACCQAALTRRDRWLKRSRSPSNGRFASAERLQRFMDRLEADGGAVKLLRE
jgi:hypothetical protein